jgi:hypothetical protein
LAAHGTHGGHGNEPRRPLIRGEWIAGWLPCLPCVPWAPLRRSFAGGRDLRGYPFRVFRGEPLRCLCRNDSVGVGLPHENEFTERWSELTSARLETFALTFGGLGSSRATSTEFLWLSRNDAVVGASLLAIAEGESPASRLLPQSPNGCRSQERECVPTASLRLSAEGHAGVHGWVTFSRKKAFGAEAIG